MSLFTSIQLESLSNEVLLEIFEYLDAYTLCSVFYRMNWRLHSLIRLCQLYIRFDKHKRDKRVWDTLATFVNPEKIYALSSYGVVIHERFLPSITENLISLCFYGMNQDSMDRILQHLPTGNRIKTLCIYQKSGHMSMFSNCIFHYVFSRHGHRLTSLVNCSLEDSCHRYHILMTTVVFSKLRRLSLSEFRWTSNLVQFLRENTPNLRSLYFHQNVSLTYDLIPCVIKHIRELDINVKSDLPDLEYILSTLPCLKRLRILWDNTRWSAIVDGTQWQKVIEKYLPCLQHLTLDFAIEIDEDIAKTFYTGEFWSTRKVVMKFVINKTQSRYRQVKTIYFGRQWHFKYFDSIDVKDLGDRHNLKLQPQPSSRSYRWSQLRSPSPLQLLSRSRSPSSSHSRSHLRPRRRLQQRSRSLSLPRRRLQRRSRSSSELRSRPRQRLQRRSRPRPCLRSRSQSPLEPRSRRRQRLQGRSRSPSESRSRLRRRLRRRSRSPSESRSRSRRRLRRRSRSPSESRSRSRRRLRRRSRSRSRSSSESRSRSRRRLRRRSRSRSSSESRSQSRRRLRRRSRSPSESRSRPRRRLRQRSRSPSESRSRSRRRLRRRSRSRSSSESRSKSRRRLRRRSRSPSESWSRPRRYSQR